MIHNQLKKLLWLFNKEESVLKIRFFSRFSLIYFIIVCFVENKIVMSVWNDKKYCAIWMQCFQTLLVNCFLFILWVNFSFLNNLWNELLLTIEIMNLFSIDKQKYNIYYNKNKHFLIANKLNKSMMYDLK
jgi:hypothetical protein